MFPQDFEYQATQILPSMIESKLTLFKMQVKGAGGHSTEATQSTFCIAPEALYTVDVITATSKLIFAMINAKMLAVPDIN